MCSDPFPMETANRTIAKMWNHGDGHECYLRKIGNVWMLTLERAGTILNEMPVDSPGEAIRQADELRRNLLARGDGKAAEKKP